MKVIVDNKIPFIKEAIEKIADEVVYAPGKDFTPSLVKDADALIIRTRTRCNRELLAGSQVKFIATATIGFDHIDTEYCHEAGIMPSEALLSAMRHYNMQLAQAGVLKAGEGQKPSRDGARIKFQQSKPLITDGPFTETKELLAGFYLLDARDINEAIQLAGNIPPARYGSIEIRPVRELQTEQNSSGSQGA